MTARHSPLRRHSLRVALLAIALLGAVSPAARAQGWGEVSQVRIPTGTGSEEVNFKNSQSIVAFAADSADRSYYIGDEPSKGEFRIQRFVEGKADAAISFQPPETKNVLGKAGEDLQLVVDPARNRVYALVVYLRREGDEAEVKAEEKEEKQYEKELKEEEKGEKPPNSRLIKSPYQRFPLDSGELAAEDLYAFEYAGGKLVSAKLNPEEKPVPLIGEGATGLKAQGEAAKEALLRPRGMAVDPATGDLVILGAQDDEEDLPVEKEEAQKQCRAAGQFVLLEVKSGKLSGKLGHRYVDSADALRPGQTECEPEEHTDVPLSPVITPAGNMLVYSAAETEGQIWEFPTPGSASGEGELETHPKRLYEEAKIGPTLDLEPPEDGAGPTMSFVPEGAGEGTIYLATRAFTYYPAPLALHYAEGGGGAQVSVDGWTAGSATASCGIPRFESAIMVDGLTETKLGGKGGVLVLAPWIEEGTHTPFVEAFEFGPGGSTAGCPTPSLSTPRLIFGDSQDAHEVVTGEGVSIASELTGADAKSVEWRFKYNDPETGTHGEETVTQTGAELLNHAGEYELSPLAYTFSHVGDYEVTEIVKTDDLAQEEAQAAEVLKVTAVSSPLRINPKAHAPVRAGEEEAELTASVSDLSETKLHLKKVSWNFGDGSPAVEEQVAAEEPNPTELHIKHTFVAPCKGKCKITLTVEDTANAGKPTVDHFEITVNPSHVEEEAAKRKAEEERRKAEQEVAQRKAEQEAAQHKAEEEANQRKAAEEAAQRRAAEEAAALAAKHKAEEEAAKKQVKPPTRAQLLTKALAACKKQPKSKRAKCQATAHRKYGPKPKRKHKK
jgi:hypothetical protein